MANMKSSLPGHVRLVPLREIVGKIWRNELGSDATKRPSPDTRSPSLVGKKRSPCTSKFGDAKRWAKFIDLALSTFREAGRFLEILVFQNPNFPSDLLLSGQCSVCQLLQP